MLGAKLLRLNDEGKLVVGDRVARIGSRYVLRYLDEDGTRWLDPDVERASLCGGTDDLELHAIDERRDLPDGARTA